MNFTGPSWLRGLTEEVEKLHQGKAVSIGGKIYAVCPNCRKFIRLDKPIVGSLHSCVEEDY